MNSGTFHSSAARTWRALRVERGISLWCALTALALCIVSRLDADEPTGQSKEATSTPVALQGLAILAANNPPQSAGSNPITIDSLTGDTHVSIPANTTLILDNSIPNIFDGRITGGGIFEKTGTGSFTFSAQSNSNNFNFAGTIQLDASTMEFQGGTADRAMTIGTLQLTGGTLLLSDAYINVKTLNITADTILDFGTGTGSTLNANNIYIAAGVTLTVKNWSSEIDFLFANSNFRQNDSSGTSATFNATGAVPENQIVFENSSSSGGNAAWINYNYDGYTNYEIRPIPEPSTYGLVLITGCVTALAWKRRQRRRPRNQRL